MQCLCEIVPWQRSNNPKKAIVLSTLKSVRRGIQIFLSPTWQLNFEILPHRHGIIAIYKFQAITIQV